MANRNSIAWNLRILLKFDKYAQIFPDYPKNFIPPPLLDPNYVPPSRRTPVLVIICIFMALSTIAVAARLWVRLRNRKLFGPDDWWIIPAWIFNMGFSVTQLLLCVIGGVGMHVYDVTYSELYYGLLLELPDLALYCTAKSLTKTSILLFYWRISSPLNTTFRKLIIITMVLIWTNIVAAIFANIFACRPLAATWDLTVRLEVYDCLNFNALVTAVSAVHAALDFWFVCLPMPIVWRLRLPPNKKLGILMLFGLGFIATAAATVKAANVWGVYNTWDPTWNSITTILAIQIETQIGLIVACLPALNVYFIKLIPNGGLNLPRPLVRVLRYFETKSGWSPIWRSSQAPTAKEAHSSDYPKSTGGKSSSRPSGHTAPRPPPPAIPLPLPPPYPMTDTAAMHSSDSLSYSSASMTSSEEKSPTLTPERIGVTRTAWYSDTSLNTSHATFG